MSEQVAQKSRYAAWRGSWSLALRIARRDARRHKGRSVLAVVMIALPTALLSFALTLNATSAVTGAELVPGLMGDGAAYVTAPNSGIIEQDPDWTSGGTGAPEGARKMPGFVNGDDPSRSTADLLRTNTAAVAAFTHGRAIPVLDTALGLRVGDRQFSAPAFLSSDLPHLGAKATLVDGRWPSGPGEVVVTTQGLHHGVPRTGAVEVAGGDGRTWRPARVVGVAEVAGAADVLGDLGSWPLDSGTAVSVAWIIERSAPVTWAELQSWGTYGVRAASAEVLRNPPAFSDLSPAIREMKQSVAARDRLLLSAGGALLLVATTLLVAPSFAVGAERSRRSLALAASNGAETAQLRRTVLGQAVVLGLLAAVAGTATGAGAVALLRAGGAEMTESWGPFDPPWLQLLGVTLAAVVSAFVAALLPARRLGRIDVIGVLKGQVAAARPSRVVLLVGVVMALVGGFGVFTGITGMGGVGFLGLGDQTAYLVAVATVVLVVGSLLLVPTALFLAARLGSRLPLSVRLALRDLDRHRTRSAPAVAAVVGVVSAFTVLAIGLTSDTAQRERDYLPQTAPGMGLLWTSSPPAAAEPAIAGAAHGVDPRLTVSARKDLGATSTFEPGKPAPWAAVFAPGCAAAEVVGVREPGPKDWVASATGQPSGPPQEGPTSVEPRCRRLGSSALAQQSAIQTSPPEAIIARFSLTGADADRVRAGTAVLWGPKASAATEGRLDVRWGTLTTDAQSGATTAFTSVGSAKVAFLTVPATKASLGRFGQQSGLVIPDSVLPADVPGLATTYDIAAPSGTIDEVTEQRLAKAYANIGQLTVERGFVRDDALVMAIIVAVMTLLLLVVALTTTALSVAEQQNDQATYAALGATRATRRRMAAAAAGVTTLLGTVLGMAVGWVPGVSLSYPLTSDSSDPVTGQPIGGHLTAYPWLWFVLVLVVVPLVAAALAWLGIRRAPGVTRRAT